MDIWFFLIGSEMRNRVIYVAGYGRSGSTVVDIALGMHPEIFGAGEISAMCRHAWRENEFCACGERLSDCPVWGPVMSGWTRTVDPVAHDALQRAVEPLFAPARMGVGRRLETFLAQSGALFSAIRAQTGAPISMVTTGVNTITNTACFLVRRLMAP